MSIFRKLLQVLHSGYFEYLLFRAQAHLNKQGARA